jgi:hypothetical protein
MQTAFSRRPAGPARSRWPRRLPGSCGPPGLEGTAAGVYRCLAAEWCARELAAAVGDHFVHIHVLTIPNWQIFPTILKLLKKCDENAPS